MSDALERLKTTATNMRTAVFGLSGRGIVMVHGPKDYADCGLYVHVDDIEKYNEFQKQFDDQPAEKDEEKA